MLTGANVWAQAAGASSPGANGAAASGAASATDGKAALSDVERAKRDADKVFQWIKFHAEKGETKKPEHQAKTDAKPEPKPAAAVAKAPAPAKKGDSDEGRTVASASAADVQRGDGGGMTRTSLTTGAASAAGSAAAPANPATPAYTGRIPDTMAMAAPTTAPSVGVPAAPAQQPEPEPAPLPEEDTPLRLITKVDPEYPRALLSQQRNGSVLVKFVVQADGSVEGVEALKSPDRKLSAAAVAAVKQWRFAPVNKPRPVSVEIGFQME